MLDEDAAMSSSIAAHLRKEKALLRCKYNVENCPPPPARERPVACYNFEKPRARRVNRDACRRGAGAQILKFLPEPALRRAWAVLAPEGPPPRIAQAAPAAVAVLLATRRAFGTYTARRLREAWTALRGSNHRPLALLLGACASRWRRNAVDRTWRALGRDVKAGRRSEQSRRAALDAVAHALGRCTRSRRRWRLLRAWGRVLATATANPAPTPCSAVAAAVANVARSQNQRRKLRALDALNSAARAAKALLRVLRFRVVAEKRTALSRLRRGADGRRRHAAVVGALIAASRRWNRRRETRALKTWAQIVRPKWVDRGAALRACGAMAVAAARRAAWARLAHHDRIHRNGVFRTRCLAAAAAADARRRVAERTVPIRCRALEEAKHVALKATVSALARAHARRSWSRWRVHAAARGARRAVEKAVSCAHHASARLDSTYSLIGDHWDLARKLGFYVLRRAGRPVDARRLRRAFTRIVAADAEARMKADTVDAGKRATAAAEKRAAVAIAAATASGRRYASIAREAAATVAVEARDRAMTDLAALRALAARDVASAVATADAAVAARDEALDDARAARAQAAADRATPAAVAGSDSVAKARALVESYTFKELQRKLKSRELRAAGKKQELTARLEGALVAELEAVKESAPIVGRLHRDDNLIDVDDPSEEEEDKEVVEAPLAPAPVPEKSTLATRKDEDATVGRVSFAARKAEEATPLTLKVKQAKKKARAARKKKEKAARVEAARARVMAQSALLTPLLECKRANTIALFFRAWRRRSHLSRPGAVDRAKNAAHVLRKMARRGSVSAAFVLWRRAWLMGAVSAPGPASPRALEYAADY